MMTASSLPRLLACPDSALLPRAENASEWADLGVINHERLAAEVPEQFAHLIPAGSRHEVKLAFDVATRKGRIIGEGAGRDYGSPAPFEIVGTTDVVGVDGDDVVVLDWKTGGDLVAPAASNGQLWFYALAATRALDKDGAIIRIVYTVSGLVDEACIGPLELAEFADKLEWLYRHVAKGKLIGTREGSWCKYCPAKHACPAKVSLIARVATQGLDLAADEPSAMTNERARDAYFQLLRFEDMIRDARKRLETYIDDHGAIDLGTGRVFGRYRRPGNEKLDGDLVVRAIKDVVGDAASVSKFKNIAVTQSTSKAAIERAAKAVINGAHPERSKEVSKLSRAIIERARELGGVTTKDMFPIGEYVPGKVEPAEKPPVNLEEVNRLLLESA